MKPWSFFLFSFLLLSASFPAPGRAQETLSLAGKWRFRLLAPGEKPLVGPKAEDSAWPSIRVPGHWELHGFGKTCYETPNDETGLYRRRVTLPAAWQGKRVFLRAFGIFEGVDIFVNGKKAARHEGGYTPFRIEITSLVRPGEKNLLALVVQKKIPHYRIDNGDFWQLGGIYKKIDLLALPGEAAILRCRWRTPPGPDGLVPSGRVLAQALVEIRKARPGRTLSARLEKAGHFLARAAVSLPSKPGKSWVEVSLPPVPFLPWNAEEPNLYTLTLTLQDPKVGPPLQEERLPLGFRVLAVRGGRLLLNGKPLTLRGTGTLDIQPDQGRAITPDRYARDVALMKKANINTLRPGWSGTDSALLDLADKEGLYILGEAPFSNCPVSYLRDPALFKEFLSRTREAVLFLENHPSVILYTVGNENGFQPVHHFLLSWIRKEDPTRPVLAPRGGWASYKECDLVSFHYPGTTLLEDIARMAAKERPKPLIFTEFCHGLYRGGGGFEWLWRAMRSTPLVAGGCQFAWCDQGLYLKRDGRPVLDSQGPYGTDGMVSAGRAPQEEYFQVRRVYCPVKVREDRVAALQPRIRLTVTNEHDFLSLRGFHARVSWRSGLDGEELARALLPLPPLPPHTRGALEIPFEPSLKGRASHLLLQFLDPRGRALGEKALPLPAEEEKPAPLGPPPTLTKKGSLWTLRAAGTAWALDAARLEILGVQRENQAFSLHGPGLDLLRPPFPHLAFRKAPDDLLEKAEPLPRRVRLVREILNDKEAGGIWEVDQAFRTPGDWPGIAGFRCGFRITLDRWGGLNLHWAQTWTGRSGRWIRRWGITLAVEGARRIAWHGRGPGRSFPDKWAQCLPGCYSADLTGGTVLQNRQDVSRIALSGKEGALLAALFRPALGLRVTVPAGGPARLGLAARVQGIGNKARLVMPPFRVIPSRIRTIRGSLRLVLPSGAWWKSAGPPPWPADPDGDGLDTAAEKKARTNPLLADSDGDGLSDAKDPAPADPDVPERRIPDLSLVRRVRGPDRTGKGWAWFEAERFHHKRGGNVDRSKGKTCLGGACLGGFRDKGEGAAWALRLEKPPKKPVLVLRYARAESDPSSLVLTLVSRKTTITKALSLPCTGGWGRRGEEWRHFRVPLPSLGPGPFLLELSAARGPGRDNLNLDGFWILEKGTPPPLREKQGGPKNPIQAFVPIRPLTKGPLSHWFGYYDKFEFDPTDRYVLAMEVGFDSREPTPEDSVTLGYIDLDQGDRWVPFAESRAWAWQQGCMLQWLPGSKREVIYNDLRGGRYVSVIRDVFSGKERVLPRPVYTVSPRGNLALSVNFARVRETRPGYGYAGPPDPFEKELHPARDGIRIMDLATGRSRLIVSLDRIARLGRRIVQGEGEHWFNHLLFDPSGKRFIFLHRWYQRAWREGGWLTRMFTSDLEGKDLRCVDPYGRTSHFIWRDPSTILTWTWMPRRGSHYYLIDEKTGRARVIGEKVLTQNGHMSYSPDRKWILTDTYPDPRTRWMRLMLFRPAGEKLFLLARFYHPARFRGPFRCDLHPRWSRDGKKVCVDSISTGRRQVYLLDVSRIVGK